MKTDLDTVFHEIRMQMRRGKEKDSTPQISKHPLEYRITIPDRIPSQRYAITLKRKSSGTVIETYAAVDRPQYICEIEGSLLDALTLVQAAMIFSFSHCEMGKEEEEARKLGSCRNVEASSSWLSHF